ncbi:Sec-independent protein translocase subunit TatA [Pseudonocardia phyllosphaerae]|uniref:Sec-independent protein translocase subunit TatA n=1 Tax=Pseudonocardia phyllosphaerae TaxID=3390502 RepID=UPI00397C74D9
MGAMSPTHWLIVLVVLVLLFGAKKLPDMARSLGRSSRILQSEMRGLKDDRSGDRAEETTQAPAVEQARPVQAQTAEHSSAPQTETRS